MATPAFVVVEIACEHANQVHLLPHLSGVCRQGGAEVYAASSPGRVVGLEPGTVSAALLVARWADVDAARRVTTHTLLPRLREALPSGSEPTVLLAESLPDLGLPDMMDIPTRASVPRPAQHPRNAFLLVRGTAWDQARLNQYRDIILPMHKERGGYYEAFAIQPGQVEALSGEWTEQILAISRWPARAVAEDFWFSDRYQTEAIPLRLGAGRFTVHMVEAAVD